MSTNQEKTVVVTGGNSGIGYATAEEFLKKGYKVLITGRNTSLIEKAVQQLGEGAAGVTADQLSLTDIKSLAEFIRHRYGKIDALFLNAGIFAFASVEDTTEEQFDSMMDINFKGAFFTAQQLIPLINEGGSITFLSSIHADTGMPNSSVYSASKAAVNALVRTLSRELAPKKIRVNGVNPGPVSTPILDKANVEASAVDHISNLIPLKRMGYPSEIAKLVTFLASPDASFITGAEINADGGMAVHPMAG
ncbi:SDR family oxidoreductase [Chitinophaga sp. sic0106]|uniref:SDR family oxidoreductase n=1 Tax=Chitinophaga sp. sic0106 TaxID=2854785 RepID=UPI001C475634|nr:SDR family oxidoreductase [Chitinophaga sp. sic0106]MBV7529811.1 SDR family oxidoreductase [Chitinophaga sp. sic0106]